MAKVRMKLNYNNFANQTIRDLNARDALLDKHEIERDLFSAADVGFTILSGYLIDIAKRAIELNDPVLLEALKGIGAVSDDDEATQAALASA